MCLLLCLFVDTSKYNPVFRSCPKPDYQNIFYLCKSQNLEGLLVITINTYTKNQCTHFFKSKHSPVFPPKLQYMSYASSAPCTVYQQRFPQAQSGAG